MLVLSAETLNGLAPLECLIEALREAFRAQFVIPERQVISIPGGSGERLFVAMPAFDGAGGGIVKLATVFPDNSARRLPSIQAAIVVFSECGTPIAVVDGTFITKLRTGAASALASTYLSRPESAQLLIIGTGALAPLMAAAHCVVRPIQRVWVWGRQFERAVATVNAIRGLVAPQIEVLLSPRLEDAVAAADIVCTATSSSTPVLHGKWLKPGTFVDLVGSFSPSKREADDDVVLRSRIFADTFAGVFAEAGDILDPLERGIITRERIEAELAGLVCGRSVGRKTADEITLFKSVGTAIEDLAACQCVIAAATHNTAN